ncbi:MAG TPA: hypothetical protein VF750_00100 [Sphingomicrobium sp.]
MRSYMLLPCFALLAAAAPASTNPPPVASQIAQAPDLPTTTTAAGGGAAAKTVAPQDKKICKQLETTGSRLPRRACLTAKEWKQVEDDLSR